MAKDGSSGSRGPRTVADATRFTSNTPHAKSKAAPSASTASPASPSSSRPSPSSKQPASKSKQTSKVSPQSQPQSPSPSQPRTTPLPNAPRMPGQAQPESVEDRVRRLRAAHLAARQHNVSRFDQVVGTSRRFFDAAHKFTVLGLIGFSGIALLVTIYAAGDMMIYNRKRRSEFFALQQHLKEDSFEAARLAYISGTATEEQIAIVDEATEKAAKAGTTLPALLASSQFAESQSDDAADSAPFSAPQPKPEPEPVSEETEKKGGVMSWLFRDLKKDETREDPLTADPASASQRAPGVAQAVENKAKAAFDQEKENQRTGGPLDQLGLDPQAKPQSKKSGWFW